MQRYFTNQRSNFGMDLPLPFIVFTHNAAQIKKEVPIIRNYHNHTLHANPRHCEEEPH